MGGEPGRMVGEEMGGWYLSVKGLWGERWEMQSVLSSVRLWLTGLGSPLETQLESLLGEPWERTTVLSLVGVWETRWGSPLETQ